MCHAVLYKQLSAWMLHGLLLDQHEEFFIKQGPCSGNVSAQAEEDDDDLGIGGLTGKQLRDLQDMVRIIASPELLWDLAFALIITRFSLMSGEAVRVPGQTKVVLMEIMIVPFCPLGTSVCSVLLPFALSPWGISLASAHPSCLRYNKH